MLSTEFKEELEDGKVLIFCRNGIFQARLYKGNRQYIYKSLKTRKVEEARKLALKHLYEMEFKQREGLPLQHKSFNEVIDEYITLRQSQYQKSLDVKTNSSSQQQTSVHMLRQIKRVAKFWREYCGTKSVSNIDNAVLQDYVPWRKDYYHRMDEENRPRNYKSGKQHSRKRCLSLLMSVATEVKHNYLPIDLRQKELLSVQHLLWQNIGK
jgi:transcription termination factor NusB